MGVVMPFALGYSACLVFPTGIEAATAGIPGKVIDWRGVWNQRGWKAASVKGFTRRELLETCVYFAQSP
jgi:hypothetical protein